jgi:hypothetical protein
MEELKYEKPQLLRFDLVPGFGLCKNGVGASSAFGELGRIF